MTSVAKDGNTKGYWREVLCVKLPRHHKRVWSRTKAAILKCPIIFFLTPIIYLGYWVAEFWDEGEEGWNEVG